MSKSDNIYNALDYARNKLKSATEAKGAAVASPYSLMDIAAAVQNIENGLEVGVLVSDSTGLKVQPLGFEGTSATANGTAESYAAKIFNTGKDEPSYASCSGGTSAEYYKCASISSGASQPEGYTLSMVTKHDGSSYEKFDFILEDPSKTGSERRWFTSDGTYRLSMGSTRWCVVIMDLGEVAMQLFSAEQTVDNPWDATSWYDETDTFSYFDVSWTVSPAVSGGNTWSGYKAVFDSTAGTWSFESDVTEGLTYTSVTPIVGGIYSADALVTVASVYLGYYPTSAPVNPSGSSDGDWVISASSYLDSARHFMYAFYEQIGHDNYCWHSQSGMPQWIQWQNTAQKVLIKSYILTQRDSADFYSSTWTLAGSDDGVNWVELDNVSLDSVGASQATVRNLTSNNTAYYYHRITVTKSDITGTSYATIGRIQAFNYLQ